MKYIRTKDRLLKFVNETADFNHLRNRDVKVYWCEDNRVRTRELIGVIDDEVIKQADTIEELCDEFVIKAYISSYPQIYHSVDLKELNEHREKDTEVFGAIWTSKGLIYVAKMNDKGELELL